MRSARSIPTYKRNAQTFFRISSLFPFLCHGGRDSATPRAFSSRNTCSNARCSVAASVRDTVVEISRIVDRGASQTQRLVRSSKQSARLHRKLNRQRAMHPRRRRPTAPLHTRRLLRLAQSQPRERKYRLVSFAQTLNAAPRPHTLF